jgi:DNA-binding response OmpR family regulator
MKKGGMMGSGNNAKILICDDDDQFRQSMQKILEKDDYNVTVAANGIEAIERAKELCYDLIIMDIRMPDIDGIETLKKIRDIQGDRPSEVIVVTGYASEDAPIEALKLGVSDYLVKPFDMQVLLNSVKKNIELVSALKDREYFYRRLLQKSEQIELTNSEISRLKSSLGEDDS